jgi:hypothetical protein
MIDILIPKFVPSSPRSAVENMKVGAEGSTADIIAFLHDDVDIHFQDWETTVGKFFADHPQCGMLGFGGARGLGAYDIYKLPYDYRQLARIDYMSNTDDAEVHGRRVTEPTQVAVLDGFCQIIRRTAYEEVGGWQTVLDMGIPFHCYDLAMACLMKEKGWEVWMLPIPCHHYGGRTSTTAEYDTWLRSRGINGDAEIHSKAHRVIYDRFRNVLPIWIGGK